MMKKCSKTLLAAAVAATMIGVMGCTAWAEEASTTPKKSDSTTVKYKVTEGYTWAVPSTIDFEGDKGINQTSKVTEKGSTNSGIRVTQNIIGDKKKLVISISENQDFKIKNGSTELGYTVYKGEDETNVLKSSSELLSVNAGTNSGSQAITFVLSTTTGAAEIAGDYIGTLGYTASVVDQ